MRKRREALLPETRPSSSPHASQQAGRGAHSGPRRVRSGLRSRGGGRTNMSATAVGRFQRRPRRLSHPTERRSRVRDAFSPDFYGDLSSMPSTSFLRDLEAPAGAAGRAGVEAALASAPGAARFIGWTLASADLGRLDLHGCHFVRCRAPNADLSSADLIDARFENCDLNNTRWRGARLAAAQFEGCKLTGANFQEASTLGMRLSRSLLVNASARRLSFRREVLEGVNFDGADLAGCDFREAVLMECSLREANITDARFEGADLRGADIGAIRLTDAGRFRGAVISKSQAAMLLSGLGLKVV